MYKKILVSINDSEGAFKALAHASDLADFCSAELFILYILNIGTALPEADERAAALAGKLAVQAENVRLKLAARWPDVMRKAKFMTRAGKNIANLIVTSAEELGCELIVLGCRRLPGTRAVIGRSVTNAVISACDKTVLIV